MHFKRLELIGFKSFRDRTLLEFEPGVTAIVGPNGCGKSNISDAIRWVLGEQSAKDLRGGRMEDVIFNGTQKDEPLGLAEVSLTLSNEKKLLPIEYDEVTITRRLFRSGESEYLINHTPVRLRDVVELVMGTGLGQTSYAHMAQGKIDEILSARPEERRYLFEEASGITKFRSQKKETLRKLEQTEANLLRVSDILNELGRQIRSLERQAEKARRYREGFEKLKALELGVARLERGRLTAELRSFSEKETALQKEAEALSKEKEDSLEKLRALRQDLSEAESALNTLQGRKMELLSRSRQGADRILLHRERIEELGAARERLELEKNQLKQDLENFRKHLEASQKDFEETLKEMEAQKTTLVSLEFSFQEILKSVAGSEETIAKGKLHRVEIAKAHATVKNDLNRLTAEHHTLSSRQQRLLREKEETEREHGEVRVRRETAERTAQEVRETSKVLKEEKETLGKTLETLCRMHDELGKEIQKGHQKLAALVSRCELLEEARKNDEGFSQGTKAFLKETEKNPAFRNCRGILANLVKAVPGYERAIEELLGPMVQAIVVADDRTAREGIRYLESGGFGRATFLVASHFRKGSVTGNALEKISITPDLEPILSTLLGEAMIVEKLDDIPLAQSGRTYVTPKGECYRSGVLSGGSPLSEELGLIGREAKVAALRDEIAQLEKRVGEAVSREKSLEREKTEKEKLLQEKIDLCHKEDLELSNQEYLLEGIQTEERRIQEEEKLVLLELEEVRDQLQDLEVREKNLVEELKQVEEEEQMLQEELTRHQSLIEAKKRDRETALVQIAEVKTTIDSAAKRHEEKKKAHLFLENTLNEKESLIAAKEAETKRSIQRIQELTEEIRRLEEEGKGILIETEELEKVLEGAEAEQKEKLAEELTFQNSLTELESRLDGLNNQMHEIAMKEQHLQYEVRSLEERIRLSYKVELDSSEEGEPVDPEAAQPEIERLRIKLERMGPVNLVAIEEYEELKKRFEFLTQQKEDLEKAKVSLHEAIQKINKVTRELFLATFRQIQTNFQEYFRLLFGGGRAELLLLDENDVLESGIEILACPPGKKLQSVSLLSGGERAMTVIALLFAVFKERPSPFCVLDEIDAPLDDSNVARFTSVLQEFLKSSQFILVTHNKRTITMADVMYGITMEKTGVSKIVSAKFKDEESARQAVPV